MRGGGLNSFIPQKGGRGGLRWGLNRGFTAYSVFLFDVVCRRHHLSRRRVIPLPKMKANPVTHPQALFQTDQVNYSTHDSRS